MNIIGKSFVNGILNMDKFNLKVFQMRHDVIKKSVYKKFAKSIQLFWKKVNFWQEFNKKKRGRQGSYQTKERYPESEWFCGNQKIIRMVI